MRPDILKLLGGYTGRTLADVGTGRDFLGEIPKTREAKQRQTSGILSTQEALVAQEKQLAGRGDGRRNWGRCCRAAAPRKG